MRPGTCWADNCICSCPTVPILKGRATGGTRSTRETRGTSPRASRTATSTSQTNRSARRSASRRGSCPPMDDGVAIGVDVGGTKVALVLLDRGGAVLAERRLVNDAFADADVLLGAIAREADKLAATAPVSVEGVGVGICELV